MAKLFEDSFAVKDIDPDGKKFDRVSRIHCRGENHEMDLVLDVNTQLYPMGLNDRFTLVLANTLNEDGTLDDGTFDATGRRSLADQFEYVMYGRVYRCDEEDKDKLSVYISFGGLLMRLKGDARSLQAIELDSTLYLLVRKV
eukprot:Opistho-2@66813